MHEQERVKNDLNSVCARVLVTCYVIHSSESQVLIIAGLATDASNNHPLMICCGSSLLELNGCRSLYTI